MTEVAPEPAGGGELADPRQCPAEPWQGPVILAPAAPIPAPVLAPYLGLVAAVLCALGGGWLLLAPYALDFRHAAASLPRPAVVDLGTGAAVIAAALLSAASFSAALIARLREQPDLLAEPAEESAGEESAAEEASGAADGSQSTTPPDAEPHAAAPSEPQPESEGRAAPDAADPGGTLREMLTPLVAALAADLRSQDSARQNSAQRDSTRFYGASEDRAYQDTAHRRRQEP